MISADTEDKVAVVASASAGGRGGAVMLSGWETVQVSRSLEAAAGTFSLGLARPEGSPEGHPLVPGDAVRVELGGDVVSTGHVDRIAPFTRSGAHGFAVAGRSKTADLVDCSAVNQPGQWRGARLVDIVKALADPFGVAVRATAPPAAETVDNFEIEQGETVWAAIERLIRIKGILAHDSADGALLLALPALRRAETALVNLPDRRTNVLESSLSLDLTGRFSEVAVKGQRAGTNDAYGTLAASVAGRALDADVPRYRPLVLVAETSVDPAQATRRAEWEVARRAGRGTSATFRVSGWRQSPGGPLWDVDLVVPVRDRALGIDAEMLITSVSWSLTADAGRQTTLTLRPPAAFKARPVQPRGQGEPYGNVRRDLQAAEAAQAAVNRLEVDV